MLCVPAKSPGGSRSPARGTNPHKHKTEWELCAPNGSRHQKHASAWEDTVSTWGVGGKWYHRSGLSAAMLINGEWMSCRWNLDTGLCWGPSSSLPGRMCVCVCVRWLQGPINPFIWNLAVWSRRLKTAGLCNSGCRRTEGGEEVKGKLNKSTVNMFSHTFSKVI